MKVGDPKVSEGWSIFSTGKIPPQSRFGKGNESAAHKLLVATGKRLLLEMGFSEDEIRPDYFICVTNTKSKRPRKGEVKYFIIDVAGVSESRRVAVECGYCNRDKLTILGEVFDEVIRVPYSKREEKWLRK